MTTYRETILSLINESPFDIDSDIQIRGRPLIMASSEFLTNKEQGDWAEQVVFNAINKNSEEYWPCDTGERTVSPPEIQDLPSFTLNIKMS